MEVQEVKIEIPMHMFEFKPPEEELKRKEPTPEPVVDKVEIPVGSAAKLPANSPNSSDSMDAEKTDDDGNANAALAHARTSLAATIAAAPRTATIP